MWIGSKPFFEIFPAIASPLKSFSWNLKSEIDRLLINEFKSKLLSDLIFMITSTSGYFSNVDTTSFDTFSFDSIKLLFELVMLTIKNKEITNKAVTFAPLFIIRLGSPYL